MDKYNLVLDIVEHPEKYPAERLDEIMSDRETKEIYNLLCKADSSLEARKSFDTDAEWEDFSHKHMAASRRFLWLGSRAASIVAFAATSLVAVAVGVAVTVAIIGKKPETATTADGNQSLATVETTNDTSAAIADSVFTSAPIMFEDETLENIMKVIESVYDVTVHYNNPESGSLHLYYKFDPTLSLDEIISQLNTFEQINIKRNGNALTID